MRIFQHRSPPMMRNVARVVLNVIAGFFFYMVCLLGFIDGPSIGAKWGNMFGFTIPAVISLCGGLALRRFYNWKRDTGIVLLCASGFTGPLILTSACLFMDAEFRNVKRPVALAFFSNYFTGGAMIVGLAGWGWMLLNADSCAKRQTKMSAALCTRHFQWLG